MNVCILSGRYPSSNYDSVINHRIYADTYGYTYIHCNWPTTSKNLYFNKINYLLEYIDFFDYLVWIDDDAFFWNLEKDIMQYAPKGAAFISFCKSPSFKQLKTFLSSGQFIIKCNEVGKSFLKEARDQDLAAIKEWWTSDLGYFTNGDQDAMVYLLQSKDEFTNFELYNYKEFNSRPENLLGEDPHEPLILHFTGTPEIKWANYLKIQSNFGLHSALVPKEKLKAYRLFTAAKSTKKRSLVRKVTSKLSRWFSG